MINKLEKEVRLLKVYAIVTTLVFGVLVLLAFQQTNQKTRFTDVEPLAMRGNPRIPSSTGTEVMI